MNKLIVWFFLSLFSIIGYAEVKVQVEPSQVTLGETFKLILTQEGQPNGGIPDLSGLQQDYIILGTERHISYSVINGQSHSNSEWVITLKATKTGILTIPAIKFGQEYSSPMTINIEANAKQQNVVTDLSQQQDVVLTAEVNEPKPYVNQQIIYTVKLYNSKRLLDADYQGPQVEDALLIPLGEAKRYQTVQNNTNYVVEEQTYAIYPQKSGELKIISPAFTALVYDVDPQRIKVQDKPINLTVQPIPKQYKGGMWLPAKRVKLTEQYENSSQTVSQGSTLTRTVTLEGVGIPAQLLPNLNFVEADKFSVYPEKGAERNEVKQGDLVGSTEFKVTYLFNKAGKVTIPELSLHWFNTETGKDEIALLAPRSINITPSAASANNTAPPLANNKSSKAEQSSAASETSLLNNDRWAWRVAIIFALAWLLTLMLWGWQKRSRHSGKGQYKKALAELQKACSACDPKQSREALLKWASLHWPDAPLLNLTDLTKLVRDAHLKKQLHILSQILYKGDAKTLWRGDELLRAVYAVKRETTKKKRKTNNLPPINPF